MLFSSITFLYYFLPVVLFLYFLLPDYLKNGFLLFASLVFYGWGEPVFLVFMVFAILSAYLFGIGIEKYKNSTKGSVLFVLSVSCSVVYLGIFKYADFFLENFNHISGLELPLLRIALPIGISFYTFQMLSYLVDVYRGDTPARKDFISFALYISMFPQLIAGPIVRYTVIAHQLDEREHSFTNVSEGMGRFLLGLSKKVLLANPFGELCGIIKCSTDLSVAYIWFYAVSFAFHIYYDFSGYSDMAIGLGRIFGFSFPENFNYPYISRSISEFWRRWHISLGTWFRDYVYIPLGGNRVSISRFCFNIFLVWFLTGFWHGAGWNFIIWGLYYGLLLLLEKIWLSDFLKKIPWMSRIYVLFFVLLGFVIFDGTDTQLLIFLLRGMFGVEGLPLISKEFCYYLRSYGVLFFIGAAGSTPFIKQFYLKYKKKWEHRIWFSTIETFLLIVLCLVVTVYLVDGSYNPFLYFRF